MVAERELYSLLTSVIEAVVCISNASSIFIACTVVSKWPTRGWYNILHTINSAV